MVAALLNAGVTTVSFMRVRCANYLGIVGGLRYDRPKIVNQSDCVLVFFASASSQVLIMVSASHSENRPLRVLVVHNRYRHAGGEDSVVESEVNLLRARGHAVRLYERHNNEVEALGKAALAKQAVWSSATLNDMERTYLEFNPDIVHAHNTFPLISPAVYWFARRRNVPVVQTIHNFRLLCLQAMFLRNGEICEDCVGHTPLRGVLRKCYRDSFATSAVAGLVLQTHRLLGTYRHKVDRYIALNRFCRDKLVAGGLPVDRISIKPNFIEQLPIGPAQRNGNPLFVGRLSEEKGVDLLIAAANRLKPGITIDVVGTGPLQDRLAGHPALRVLGGQSAPRVYELMRLAPFLIMPSIWYENMPRTLVEAYASGTPVIASRLGALAELVADGVTGLLFEPRSDVALAQVLQWAVEHPNEIGAMGDAARKAYDAYYTPDVNYEILLRVYADASGGREAGAGISDDSIS